MGSSRLSQLIITPELLQALNACPSGPTFITEHNLWGQPEDVVLAAMAEAGMTQEIAWWNSIVPTATFIEAAGGYTYGPYRTFNPITKEFTQFNTLAEAQVNFEVIQQAWLEANMDRFVVDIVTQNDDNTTSWNPVDLNLLVSMGEGDFQVFNTFTGKYEPASNAAEAQADVEALQAQLLSQMIPIQQEIISPYNNHDSAWINVT